MRDLWPEDLVRAPIILKPPVIILKEQAALLGKKTNNLVEAEVAQIKPGSVDENTWFYNFLIVAPTLDYKYKLFTIKHYLYGYPICFVPCTHQSCF